MVSVFWGKVSGQSGLHGSEFQNSHGTWSSASPSVSAVLSPLCLVLGVIRGHSLACPWIPRVSRMKRQKQVWNVQRLGSCDQGCIHTSSYTPTEFLWYVKANMNEKKGKLQKQNSMKNCQNLDSWTWISNYRNVKTQTIFEMILL